MHGHTSTKLARMFVAAGAILAGCSEAPNPAAPGSEPITPNFAVGGDDGNAATLGQIRVCKIGADGSFSISPTTSGTLTTVASPTTVAAGTCKTVAEDQTPAGTNNVTVTEVSGGFLSATIVRNNAGVVAAPAAWTNGEAQFLLNNAHGATITVTNSVPSTGCTYTKGWYRNNGSSTITLVIDGRSVANQQAIFNATPGKPGSVTFQGNNTLLNLYQQLLAALNNLGGDATAGPDDVDDAIGDALAGTGGAGTAITTTLTQEEMSALINTLSAFNEGTFANWPHCDD